MENQNQPKAAPIEVVRINDAYHNLPANDKHSVLVNVLAWAANELAKMPPAPVTAISVPAPTAPVDQN